MYIIQLLLPLYGNEHQPIAHGTLKDVRDELTERFGGVTAFMRSPAEGFWKDNDNRVDRDDIIVLEVMVEDVERSWWSRYKAELEERFQQQEIVIRSIPMERL